MLVISSQVKSFISYVVIINTKVIHLEAHKMQNKVLRIIIIVMLVSVVLALLLTSIIPFL
ncbi:stressosome-associated protein Prli42 [Staphylococcus aureus]|nr:stressosome-associated protein Prli42 [Staphylococcus aureus]MBG3704919.1 stressosome-associated protein Prli42 [Staphylococcus aureus]MBU6551068.1 stressosome-associated protein Prli42 [Staphylococcus aureus]MBU6577025.1 stressosome-associated protein Prli42 [Staphylococcus aureus]HCY9610664.1 stressosome-associated protein Prli42 [Staphylococcus aureus]